MAEDIVTRLEAQHWCDDDKCNLAQLAADEIEGLRAEVARLTLLSNFWESEFKAAVNAITGRTVKND